MKYLKLPNFSKAFDEAPLALFEMNHQCYHLKNSDKKTSESTSKINCCLLSSSSC